MLLIQLLVNGIQVGALYALMAAGFSMIFGSTKIFHVAHGATFTIAAYLFYAAVALWGLPWPLAVAMAAGAAVLFGLLMDRFVYAPIQGHHGSLFTVFVASFGMVIVVQNVIGMAFGRSFVTVSTSLSRAVEILPGLYVGPIAGLAVLAALLCFGALNWMLTRTHLGMALRALSESADLVRVYGLQPRKLSAVAFVIGSLLVVPGAIITACSNGLNPAVGNHVMLISLAATIVGGVGSVRGAAIAGVVLGVAESLSLWVLEPQWSEAVAFIVLFLCIMLRPSGFFGRAIVT